MVLKRAKIFLVSELEDELIRRINFTPYKTAQETLNAAIDKLGAESRILVLPMAGSTLPCLTS